MPGAFPRGDYEGQFNQETNTITFQSKANSSADDGNSPAGGDVPF
jgi:hypothetical protein